MADLSLAAAWVTADDLRPADGMTPCSAVGDATPSDETIDAAALAASEFLHSLSGHRYPGIKEAVVTPCADRCGCSAPTPFMLPGEDYPVACGCGTAASCCGPVGITLGVAPVVEVTEVTLYGAAFVAFDLIDDVLVRTDGDRWPACQRDLTDPDLVVELTWGVAPPELAKRAARDLTCVLLRADAGDGSCVEPANVVRKTGGGMTVEVSSPVGDLVASLPRSVRMFLESNPTGPAPTMRRASGRRPASGRPCGIC